MKNIFTSLAKRFWRLAANFPEADPETVSSSPLFYSSDERDGVTSHAKISSARTATVLPNTFEQQKIPHSQQGILKPNETRDANSFNPDFITRQELSRELDLLRRLMESRK
jgi:hypothetical protein